MVVVVEHGKNGKKDKYYIIPGGAPVIFEDEDGNELTRYVVRHRRSTDLEVHVLHSQCGRL